MNRYVGRRAWSVALYLACMAMLWLAMPPESVQAHPCDDLYARQQDRETCWWNYWNSLSVQPQPPAAQPVRQYTTKPHRLHPDDPRIAPWDRVARTPKSHESRAVPTPAHLINLVFDERVCDIYYADHADRTNCRWRLQNGLPLPALATPGLIVPVVPVPSVHQPVYQPAPAPQTAYAYPPPRGQGLYCYDFDTRAQYESFYAGRAKPSDHDRDRDGWYCENLG